MDPVTQLFAVTLAILGVSSFVYGWAGAVIGQRGWRHAILSGVKSLAGATLFTVGVPLLVGGGYFGLMYLFLGYWPAVPW